MLMIVKISILSFTVKSRLAFASRDYSHQPVSNFQVFIVTLSHYHNS
jgi:hypothetical protein